MTAREKRQCRARFVLGICTRCGERLRMPTDPVCAVCAEMQDGEVNHG